MDDLDAQVLDAARRWSAAGHRCALVTVVRTWGSAPRPAGAWMALRDDGHVQGSVSGGCVEEDLIRRLATGEFAAGPPRVLRYGGTPEEAQRFGLPCGGTLELVLEAEPAADALEALARRIAAGEPVARRLDLASGGVTLATAGRDQAIAWDGRSLTSIHGPAWRLLLVGAGQIARFLAPMARALGYRVQVCDPREEYAGEWDLPDAPLLAGMPDDAVLAMVPDPRSAVVTLSHDPKLDDLALLEALKSPAFYVGALGSTASNARRRQRLQEHFDLTAGQLARLHGPVGLAIGSRTPPEIAVAILAEMTAVRHGVPPPRPAMP